MCTKGHYQQSEKTVHLREENFVNHISGNGFISRIYQELQLYNKKTPTVLKCAKYMSRHFYKEDMKMANKHKCKSNPQWDTTLYPLGFKKKP